MNVAARSTGWDPGAKTVDGLDVARIRGDFPILSRLIRGKPLIYLDNAATTQKPRSVIDACRNYYETCNANVHRGVYALSVEATQAFESARRRIANFLGASSEREIIFVRGATEAVNLVAWSFVFPLLAPGDEVLITEMEHHSNIVPWQMICERSGARLVAARITDDGEVDLADFESKLTAKTRFAAFAHASNALGTINPVRAMIGAAKKLGVPVLIDGAQAAPHFPIDVVEMGCEFYAISAHKMFGPMGIGALYGRFDLLESMPPYQGGGDMIKSVSLTRTIYNDAPFKFEAGTPHVEGAVGFGAAVEYLEALDWDAIEAHEQSLLQHATEALLGIPQVRLIGTAREKAPVVSFVVEGIHPHDLGTFLDQDGIAVRTGHHCAQPVMDRFGVPATVRASLAFYNTHEEIEALVRGLRKVIEVFG